MAWYAQPPRTALLALSGARVDLHRFPILRPGIFGIASTGLLGEPIVFVLEFSIAGPPFTSLFQLPISLVKDRFLATMKFVDRCHIA